MKNLHILLQRGGQLCRALVKRAERITRRYLTFLGVIRSQPQPAQSSSYRVLRRSTVLTQSFIMPGFWKRPVTRMYSYNLDLGEMSNRSARARSEVRTSSAGYDANNVSAFANYKNALLDTSRELRQEASANLMAREQSRSHSLANMRAEAASRRSAFQQMRASTPMTATANTESSSTTRSSYRTESKRRIEDDICKKVADVHMMPWALGTELDEAQSASARARSRISELERELEEITKRAMTTSTHARRTAAQLAKEASLEDEQAMASTYKKSRKVMIQSAQRAC